MDIKLSKSEFLKSISVGEDEFEKTGLKWEELEAIGALHRAASQSPSQLNVAGDLVLQLLRPVPEIHSLKMRLKSVNRLLEKIIKKKLKVPNREITPANYASEITDLVGIRALHLFKNDWRIIHKVVLETWDLAERPKAYFRVGDLLDDFEKEGCDLEEHPRGYRSVHYLVKCQPAKTGQIVELQVRTIFEEGWSEIDHRTGYESHSPNPVLAHFLTIFNRLAGSADEMGTFIRGLRQYIEDSEAATAKLQLGLDDAVAKLQISQDEKEKLQKLIEKERKLSTPPISFIGSPPTVTITNKLGSGHEFGPTEVSALSAITGVGSSSLASIAEDSQRIFGSWVCEGCKMVFPNMLKSGTSDLCTTCMILKDSGVKKITGR